MKTTKEKTIKVVTCWNEKFYVNPNDNTLAITAKDQRKHKLGIKTLTEASKTYKGCNVLHKPFYVLVGQQYILKNSTHGLKVENEITVEEFNTIFTTYTTHP